MKNTFLGLTLASLVVVGCTAESSETTTPTSQPSAAPSMSMGDTTAILAKLTAADAVDGTTDKVVGKCAGCALGMDGSPDHKLEMEGYAMHFCSAGCKDGFSADTAKKVLAMNIPGK